MKEKLEVVGNRYEGKMLLTRKLPNRNYKLQNGYVSQQTILVTKESENSSIEKLTPTVPISLSYEEFSKTLTYDEMEKVARRLSAFGF